MPWYPALFARPTPAKVGRPKRDRSKVKAARRANRARR